MTANPSPEVGKVTSASIFPDESVRKTCPGFCCNSMFITPMVSILDSGDKHKKKKILGFSFVLWQDKPAMYF